VCIAAPGQRGFSVHCIAFPGQCALRQPLRTGRIVIEGKRGPYMHSQLIVIEASPRDQAAKHIVVVAIVHLTDAAGVMGQSFKVRRQKVS
jgi:hypothetical protein